MWTRRQRIVWGPGEIGVAVLWGLEVDQDLTIIAVKLNAHRLASKVNL